MSPRWQRFCRIVASGRCGATDTRWKIQPGAAFRLRDFGWSLSLAFVCRQTHSLPKTRIASSSSCSCCLNFLLVQLQGKQSQLNEPSLITHLCFDLLEYFYLCLYLTILSISRVFIRRFRTCGFDPSGVPNWQLRTR